MPRILLALLLLAIALPTHAGTYFVNTTADAGPGSLRAAFETANSGACAAFAEPCTIGLGGGAADGVMPRPLITSALYDVVKNATIVEGEFGEGVPDLPVSPGDGTFTVRLQFFASASPGAGASGDAEAWAVRAYYPMSITGSRFRAELPGNLRLRFITATASHATCYWDFGCHGDDTSEISNAVRVE